ncbi:MAG: ribbon-helix-helix domain-containing protein [Proteobacteria bacterium]|nr:ribbon-helix-helix domain-containing protein [Pseudomonadota bacterium]
MKTAVSVPDDIFREVEKFAKEYHYSRSEVFVIALKEFLEKLKSAQLLKSLNDAYSEVETFEEKAVREKGKRYYAKKVLKEPF